MWGGGLRGGTVVGKTDKEGATVVDRPVKTGDFLATVCEILEIDHSKQNEAANGRPVRIVDKATPFTKDVI
jgi:arylsulfatase A-like enzyme